jgi:hypothetical protein
MINNKSIKSLFLCFFLFVSLCMCHMELKFPAPRLSQYAGIWDYTQIDYNMNAPLNMHGNLLCQGKTAMTPTATFTAGQTFTAEIVGSAPHGGGHCQFALTYDNGKTWVVIQDNFRTCPLAGIYPVTIPATAPASNNVALAWTWINAVGNREYYMNCADIIIKNPTASNTLTGKKLLVVNLPGTPTVPEFLGNLETGMDLLNARPTITVTVAGGSQPPSTPTPTPTPTPTSTPTPTAAPTASPTATPTPTPTPTPTAPSTPGTNCQCAWAAYCGADTCGVTGAQSACQCKSGSVCLGGPSYQCRSPGVGGAPVSIPVTTPPSTTAPPTTPPPTTSPPSPPSGGTNCKCLWASYCGADSCGVTGTGSACQCPSGTTCQGGPYFQCR